MVCKHCYGSGLRLDEKQIIFGPGDKLLCPECKGSGITSRDMTCQNCSGTGRGLKRTHPPLGFWPCPECQGSGIVSCCDTAGAARACAEAYSSVGAPVTEMNADNLRDARMRAGLDK